MTGDSCPSKQNISIHAPREGGDLADRLADADANIFQSTPPARGATLAQRGVHQLTSISIHAPREGGDGALSIVWDDAPDFNPRPPRGGRLQPRN